MDYKIVEEDEDFVTLEWSNGMRSSSSKHAYFSIQPERSKREDQRCRFCLNPESILTLETCCTGCGALNSMET